MTSRHDRLITSEEHQVRRGEGILFAFHMISTTIGGRCAGRWAIAGSVILAVPGRRRRLVLFSVPDAAPDGL